MPLDAIERDDHIVEDWPDPEDEDYEDEDDWDDDTDEPQDYEIKFKLIGATEEEIRTISRYLFDAIAKELEIPYEKLEGLEIEED